MKIQFAVIFSIILSPSVFSQWVQTSLDSTAVHSIIQCGDTLYAGTTEGVMLSTDGGSNWSIAGGHGLDISSMAVYTPKSNGDSIAIFVGTYASGIYVSSNGGENWQSANNGLLNLQIRSLCIAGDIVFAGTMGDGLFKSSDFGKTWSKLDIGLNNPYVEALQSKDSLIAAGTFDGVFLSQNGGISWDSTSTSQMFYHNIRSVAIHGTHIYAGLNMYSTIYHSTDRGKNWEYLSVNSNRDGWITSILLYGNTVIAGTVPMGIYVSSDNGQHWSAVNNGLTMLWIHSMCIVDNALFVGTSTGIWHIPLSEILLKVDDSTIKNPVEFNLEQNYPNPFNPTTVIGFDISENAFITLSVYNVLGEEIDILVSKNLSAGHYSVQWDASQYPSGVYLYKLQSDKNQKIKKLLLLK